MQPQGIDMSLIREAMARRQAGGGGTPVTQQVSQPQGGSPLQQTAQPVQAGALTQGAQQPAQGQQAPQQAQQGGQGAKPEAQFDDETRAVSKALIARLLKVI